jgi:hypothetical protein
MNKRHFLTLALSLTGLAGALLGCGGGGSATTRQTYTSGTIALGGTRTGVLTLITSTDSTATGQIAIEGSRLAKTRVALVYPLAGSWGGVRFQLTGTFTSNGVTFPITVNGIVPTAADISGTLTVVMEDGTTYTGKFTPNSIDNPTPPPTGSTPHP